jgi:hypothetical protein
MKMTGWQQFVYTLRLNLRLCLRAREGKIVLPGILGRAFALGTLLNVGFVIAEVL